MKQNGSLAWLFVIWCVGVGARLLSVPIIKSEAVAWVVAIAAVFAFPIVHPTLGPASTLLVALTFACALNASHGKMSQWRYGNLVKSFGAFSYSLYLTHLPLQHYLLTVVRGDADPFLSLPPFDPKAFLIIGALFAASYLFAFAFAFLTERNTPWVRQAVFNLFRRVRVAAADERR